MTSKATTKTGSRDATGDPNNPALAEILRKTDVIIGMDEQQTRDIASIIAWDKTIDKRLEDLVRADTELAENVNVIRTTQGDHTARLTQISKDQQDTLAWLKNIDGDTEQLKKDVTSLKENESKQTGRLDELWENEAMQTDRLVQLEEEARLARTALDTISKKIDENSLSKMLNRIGLMVFLLAFLFIASYASIKIFL